jgi:hypothetical protein
MTVNFLWGYPQGLGKESEPEREWVKNGCSENLE